MFLVLGLVLPLAGAPLRYCLCAQAVVTGESSCCSCADEAACSCHEECPHPPEEPSCSVTLKLLPDAVAGFDPALPIPLMADLPPPPFPLQGAVATGELPFAQPGDRGPPARLPLYLRHRSLLL